MDNNCFILTTFDFHFVIRYFYCTSHGGFGLSRWPDFQTAACIKQLLAPLYMKSWSQPFIIQQSIQRLWTYIASIKTLNTSNWNWLCELFLFFSPPQTSALDCDWLDCFSQPFQTFLLGHCNTLLWLIAGHWTHDEINLSLTCWAE